MRLIVGLGNPGRRYAGSAHNVGYEVVDRLTKRWGVKLKDSNKFLARIGKCKFKGQDVILLCPTTYMNTSGEAVADCSRYYDINEEDILVILDDINLPMGRLRIRTSGSDGGHKGLFSIIALLGTNNIPRLRIGVKPKSEIYDWTAFVLGKLSSEEREIIEKMIEISADAAEKILLEDFSIAMSKYNGFRLEEE